MLHLREVSHGHPGVLGFLMARQSGPPTLVRRPPLDCYLLGIGLSVSTIRIDANGRTLRQGTYGLHGVHLVQPKQDADYRFTGKLVNLRLRLSTKAVATAIEQLDVASAGIELTDIHEQSDRVIGRTATALVRETAATYPDDLRVDSLMQLLVDRIVRLHASRNVQPVWRESLSPPLRRRALEHIKQTYMHRVSLAELSAVIGLSPTHFLRAFRNSVGTPPHTFVTMYRLHRAGELLARTTRNLADIAASTGFSSHGHMTTTFRQWTGFAPREVRHPARSGLSEDPALLMP